MGPSLIHLPARHHRTGGLRHPPPRSAVPVTSILARTLPRPKDIAAAKAPTRRAEWNAERGRNASAQMGGAWKGGLTTNWARGRKNVSGGSARGTRPACSRPPASPLLPLAARLLSGHPISLRNCSGRAERGTEVCTCALTCAKAAGASAVASRRELRRKSSLVSQSLRNRFGTVANTGNLLRCIGRSRSGKNLSPPSL
jgi:hypothetical protein